MDAVKLKQLTIGVATLKGSSAGLGPSVPLQDSSMQHSEKANDALDISCGDALVRDGK